ncbi:MAG: type II secretion system protein [Patescibacteria group bacterium]
MKRRIAGFTLVELLVTITVVSILAAIVYANVGRANPRARDIERQADLRNLQSAIEQYKRKVGRYPAMGYPGGDGLSSEADGLTYIAGLAPEYIPVLPNDSRRGSALGYSYVTNAAGTSYKIMAVGSVEAETVTNTHVMKRCDTSSAAICTTTGVCSPSDATYQRTYALWGGFADGTTPASVKTNTAVVICS